MLRRLENWWYRKDKVKKPEEKGEEQQQGVGTIYNYKELMASRKRLLKTFDDPGIVRQYPKEFDEVGEDY